MENQFNQSNIPNQPVPDAIPQGAPLNIPDIPTVKPLNALNFTIADSVCAWICLVLGFGFTHFVSGYAGGLWGGIFWAAVGALSAVYVKIKRLKTTYWQAAVFGISEFFCFVPLFSANGLVNTLAAMFSFLLLFYLAVTVSGAALFGKHFVMDMLCGVFARPFMSFTSAPRAAFRPLKGRKNAKTVLYVVLGLLLALPLTIVVFVLLIASDGAFENAMNGFIESLPTFSFGTFCEILFAVPVGMYLFGMMFSAGKQIDTRSDGAPVYRFLPAPIAYVAVTPICLFYLVYIITQLGYFTAAFGGTLPEGYSSYSEYARRGFFELCVIAIINLCVIMLMQGLVQRKENDRRPAALRVYTVVISAFTLLLIASAFSKMIMYIKELGMTQLRIYTSWFMAVLAIAFILIIVWQFKELPFWRAMFAAFTVMLGIFCFGDIDGTIARYNVHAYQSGSLYELDMRTVYGLSLSAVKPVAELLETEEPQSPLSAEITEYLTVSLNEIESSSGFAYFSIPRISAERAIKGAGIENVNLPYYNSL